MKSYLMQVIFFKYFWKRLVTGFSGAVYPSHFIISIIWWLSTCKTWPQSTKKCRSIKRLMALSYCHTCALIWMQYNVFICYQHFKMFKLLNEQFVKTPSTINFQFEPFEYHLLLGDRFLEFLVNSDILIERSFFYW